MRLTLRTEDRRGKHLYCCHEFDFFAEVNLSWHLQLKEELHKCDLAWEITRRISKTFSLPSAKGIKTIPYIYQTPNSKHLERGCNSPYVSKVSLPVKYINLQKLVISYCLLIEITAN